MKTQKQIEDRKRKDKKIHQSYLKRRLQNKMSVKSGKKISDYKSKKIKTKKSKK